MVKVEQFGRKVFFDDGQRHHTEHIQKEYEDNSGGYEPQFLFPAAWKCKDEAGKKGAQLKRIAVIAHPQPVGAVYPHEPVAARKHVVSEKLQDEKSTAEGRAYNPDVENFGRVQEYFVNHIPRNIQCEGAKKEDKRGIAAAACYYGRYSHQSEAVCIKRAADNWRQAALLYVEC